MGCVEHFIFAAMLRAVNFDNPSFATSSYVAFKIWSLVMVFFRAIFYPSYT